MYWVPALMKNSNNYKVKLKFHLFWFIKNALFKVLIDSFQQKLLKLNGSKDSNGRVVMVYTEPGSPDVINNTILNISGSIIDPADSPVLVRAVPNARTEWKKHVHGRGEAVELIIVVVDSAVHGDSLGVPGGVDDGGQVGSFVMMMLHYTLFERFFGGPGGLDVNNINHVNDDNLTDSVNEGEEEARLPDSFWRARSTLWCRASQDVEDKQLSIFESIRIQQFWLFRFPNSSSEKRNRNRPLFKVKFVALNIWQDYISEISDRRNSNFACCFN